MGVKFDWLCAVGSGRFSSLVVSCEHHAFLLLYILSLSLVDGAMIFNIFVQIYLFQKWIIFQNHVDG